jgi:hypothetical protein
MVLKAIDENFSGVSFPPFCTEAIAFTIATV